MKTRLYGLLAEYDNPTDLVAAAHHAREAGYTRVEAYTPFPIEELADALPVGRVEALDHPHTPARKAFARNRNRETGPRPRLVVGAIGEFKHKMVERGAKVVVFLVEPL